MTVDMLAATFFWPEGTLLGAQHRPAGEDAAAGDAGAEADLADGRTEAGDGFWAAVMRNLWRPAEGPSTATMR